MPQPPLPQDADARWATFLDRVRPEVEQLLAAPDTDPELAAAATDESSPAWVGLGLLLHMPDGDPDDAASSVWRCRAQNSGELDRWVDVASAAIGPVAAAQVAVWYLSTGVRRERASTQEAETREPRDVTVPSQGDRDGRPTGFVRIEPDDKYAHLRDQDDLIRLRLRVTSR